MSITSKINEIEHPQPLRKAKHVPPRRWECPPIRIAILLCIYGAVVCTGLIVITVFFAQQSEATIKETIVRLVDATARRNKEMILFQVSHLESAVTNVAMFLSSDKRRNIQNLSNEDLVQTWETMWLGVNTLVQVISTMEYWRDTPTNTWHSQGCNRWLSVCKLYNSTRNITISYRADFVNNKYDMDNPTYQMGQPSMKYGRQTELMRSIQSSTLGTWSPLYIDPMSDEAVVHCNSEEVQMTTVYYYCMDWINPKHRGNNGGPNELYVEVPESTFCAHIFAVEVVLDAFLEEDKMRLSQESTFKTIMLNIVNNAGNACKPPPAIRRAMSRYFEFCKHVDIRRCGSLIEIDDKFMTTVLSFNFTTGNPGTMIDITPRRVFFSALDRKRKLSTGIAVGVLMIILAISTLVWWSVVVPINWISRSMQKASTLTTIRKMKRSRSFLVLTEVRQLYASYTDLCRALMDLKAYVPQCLFEAPHGSLSESLSSCPESIEDEDVSQWPASLCDNDRDSEKDTLEEVNFNRMDVDPPELETKAVSQCQVDVKPHPALSAPIESNSGTAVDMEPYANAPQEWGVVSDSTPSLRLKIIHTSANQFRYISCSFLVVSFRFRYMNLESLQEDIKVLMNVIVRVTLHCRGVIEVLRPDYVAITFGAHSSVPQHAQRAAACALAIVRRLPPKQREYTLITVDSGAFYVGNCGAHNRFSRVLFGERFDFNMELMKYNLALGHVVVTGPVAVCLPTESVLPMDNIIPLRNRVYGIQLFHLLEPRRMRQKQYNNGVVRFRQAYTLAISGNYEEALTILDHGELHDPKLRENFATSLLYLSRLTPRRPRYCRFQLPSFELLGVEEKGRSGKYQYEKITLGDMHQNTVPVVHFGLGDSVTSISESLPMSVCNEVPPSEAQNGVTELPMTFTSHQGQVLYRVPRSVGSGSSAEVYKAVSENGTIMALKCFRLSSRNVSPEDVVSEVNTACKLFNDHIVNHTGWIQVGPFLVIIMEYMAGGTLQSVLSAFPRGFTVQVARRYASDALKGLAYLHKNGIVHADFKPQNILLGVDGGCKIADFGSSVTKANVTQLGGDVFDLRGTPFYMSPQVAAGGAPSMSDDVWAFGITLYEMLTGKHPWVRYVQQGSEAHRKTKDVTPAELPSSNKQVLTRGLTNQHPGISIYSESPGEGSVTGVNLSRNPAQDVTDAKFQSDARFVQGIANRSIFIALDESLLPSRESYQLIACCLQEDPSLRPTALDLLDHAFFLV